MKLNLYLTDVKAGFPSPADDYIENTLDINEYLVKNPDATFLVRASGDSMKGSGIITDDILIIDRSLTPANNSIVLAVLNGEFTVKHFFKKSDLKGNFMIKLIPDNPEYTPIEIKKNDEFEIWGVVSGVIRKY